MTLFTRDENILVDQALGLDAGSFPKAVGHWQRLADQDRFRDDHQAMWEARSLHVSQTWGGMVRVDGNLDPETGQTITTALRSLTGPTQLDPDDRRTPTQRRADALADIARHYLDTADTVTSGGEKPHVTVLVDLETLENRAGKRCETGSGQPITPPSGPPPGL